MIRRGLNLILALYADIPFRRDIPTPFQYSVGAFQRGDATPQSSSNLRRLLETSLDLPHSSTGSLNLGAQREGGQALISADTNPPVSGHSFMECDDP
jgi:hypothetical protein